MNLAPMSRGSSRRVLAVTLLALLPAACGDPVVVLGDSPGYARVVAGRGDSVGTRVDSLATRSLLREPGAVAFDGESQLLYVADRGAQWQVQGITTRVTRIFSVTSAGRMQLLLDVGGCPGGTCLVEATALTLAPDGSLLIADGVRHRVFRFSPATRGLTVLAGTGISAFSPDGTPALQASLRRPAGIAAAADGSIYISEEEAHRVRRIDPSGVLRTVAGNGNAAHTGDGGPAASAAVHSPAGLALQGDQLFLAEAGAHTVRVVDLGTGLIDTVAGSEAAGFAGDGGPARQAALATPRALAITADGALLYISDRDNRRIRLVNLATGTITTYAGNGTAVFSGNRQPAGAIGLRTPAGIWAASGFLFIADPAMSIVWRTATGL